MASRFSFPLFFFQRVTINSPSQHLALLRQLQVFNPDLESGNPVFNSRVQHWRKPWTIWKPPERGQDSPNYKGSKTSFEPAKKTSSSATVNESPALLGTYAQHNLLAPSITSATNSSTSSSSPSAPSSPSPSPLSSVSSSSSAPFSSQLSPSGSLTAPSDSSHSSSSFDVEVIMLNYDRIPFSCSSIPNEQPAMVSAHEVQRSTSKSLDTDIHFRSANELRFTSGINPDSTSVTSV